MLLLAHIVWDAPAFAQCEQNAIVFTLSPGYSKTGPALAMEAGLWPVSGKVGVMGGVLEHPSTSRLWKVMNLPLPGKHDEFGGYTICIDQFWFGHKAQKKTFLYICGVPQSELPSIPLRFEAIQYVVSSCKRNKAGRRGNGKKEITKAEREHTPILLAEWLLKVAQKCYKYENSLPNL